MDQTRCFNQDVKRVVARLRPDDHLPRLALMECLPRSGQTREVVEPMEEARSNRKSALLVS